MHFINRTVTIIFAGLFLAAGVLFYIFYITPEKSDTVSGPALSSVEALLAGDSEKAEAEAKAFLQDKTIADSGYIGALAVLADATIKNATDADGVVRGVRILKRLYAEAELYPYARAVAVNKMISVMFAAQNKTVFDEVFRDEPFKSLRAAGDATASIENLANYSIGIFPTVDGYLALARQQAELLMFGTKAGTSDPLDLSADEHVRRNARALKIKEYVGSAENAFQNELRYLDTFSYGAPVIPWQYYWKGYVFSASARVDSLYEVEAEKNFTDALVALEAARDNFGNPIPALGEVEISTHLAYARMLHAVEGGGRAEDIRLHLSAFVASLQADPDANTGFYKFFENVRTRASVASGTRERKIANRGYREFASLASLSPELKAFLNKNGWSL